MGFELLIGALVAATSVVTGVMQYSQAKKAAKERKEANNIANANAKNEQEASRRKAVREARVRRAMVLQSSENSGASGSSGSFGAVGVIGTNLGSNNAQAQGATVATIGINNRNQKAADYEYKGQLYGTLGNAFANTLTAFQTPSPKSG